METNQLNSIKCPVASADKSNAGVKPVKSNLVKVSVKEIKSVRPSVYKYLLP